MEWYWWSLILTVIGVIEASLSEYQTLLSVRLKVNQTVIFSEINLLIDFAVSVILFVLLFDFWEQARAGIMNIKPLLPYLFYIQGYTAGTWLALTTYRNNLKERRSLLLKKARKQKKSIKSIKAGISSELIEEEFNDG